MKIKVGDNVVVITGKDKGKIGIVKETNPSKQTVIVEDINIVTRHIKPTQQNPNGGIIKSENPIHVSNVMINVGDKKHSTKAKVSRIKFEFSMKNGKKEKKRIAKATGDEV